MIADHRIDYKDDWRRYPAYQLCGNQRIPPTDFVEPEYTVPCRITITTRLEDKYKESAASLRMDLSKASSVSLTTDAWTGLATVSYPRM